VGLLAIFLMAYFQLLRLDCVFIFDSLKKLFLLQEPLLRMQMIGTCALPLLTCFLFEGKPARYLY
jgi:hypothetical protein